MAQQECSIIRNGMYVSSNGHVYYYYNKRADNLVRHEIFFGTANRQKSIGFGLYVFLKPEDHNMTEYGVHGRYGHEFDEYLKQVGQRVAMAYYNWTEKDFRHVFGKSYL